MAISIEEAKKVANLAMISIDDNNKICSELSSILALAEQLSKVPDTTEPMAHPIGAIQRYRDDVVNKPNQRTKFQQLSPQSHDDYYLVPVVIDSE